MEPERQSQSSSDAVYWIAVMLVGILVVSVLCLVQLMDIADALGA